MDKTTNFLNELNFEFFEYPPNKLKSNLTAFKFWFAKVPIVLSTPTLLISNKTCGVDKLLLASIIRGNYLILKDSVVRKLHNKSFSKSEYDSLIRNIVMLKGNGYSLLMFPEKDYPAFGTTEKLPLEISNFLFDTEYDLTFLSLINTYYSMPIWANIHRRCDTKCLKQNTITHSRLETLYQREQLELINKCMPSSASTYASKTPLFLRSNQLAEKVESVIYCCPSCKEMFSVYSEYNCLKCRNCGSAVEFSNNGKIEFTRDIYSFDYIDEFMYEQLKAKKFEAGEKIVKYDTVKMLDQDSKKEVWNDVEFTITFGEIHIKTKDKTKKISFSSIEDLELLPNNHFKIYLKKDTLTFKGENGENFYLLIHLHKLLHFE